MIDIAKLSRAFDRELELQKVAADELCLERVVHRVLIQREELLLELNGITIPVGCDRVGVEHFGGLKGV